MYIKVIIDTDSFIDGIECVSFEEASDIMLDIYYGWMSDAVTSYDDEWNCMIDNNIAYICFAESEEEYNKDNYECIYPTKDDLAEIGWVYSC